MNVEECVAEVRAFVRGGEVGLMRLSEVWMSIVRHYEIVDPDEVWARANIQLVHGQFELKRNVTYAE